MSATATVTETTTKYSSTIAMTVDPFAGTEFASKHPMQKTMQFKRNGCMIAVVFELVKGFADFDIDNSPLGTKVTLHYAGRVLQKITRA